MFRTVFSPDMVATAYSSDLIFLTNHLTLSINKSPLCPCPAGSTMSISLVYDTVQCNNVCGRRWQSRAAMGRRSFEWKMWSMASGKLPVGAWHTDPPLMTIWMIEIRGKNTKKELFTIEKKMNQSFHICMKCNHSIYIFIIQIFL